MLVSIKIIKLFINLICELIIPVSYKRLCIKTDEYAVRSWHEQEIVKICKNYNWALAAVFIARSMLACRFDNFNSFDLY